jgi:two-component system nitrogen regulation sensor histidine kinase GlnL
MMDECMKEVSFSQFSPDYVVENLHTAVILLNRQLEIQFSNAAAEMLFGASSKYLIGSRLSNWLPRTSELLNEVEMAIEMRQSYVELEKSVQLSYDRVVIIDCIVTMLTDETVLLELKQVDRQVRISREEHLFAQSSAIHQLTRGLAHEVRNPLSGLRGAAQLLERELSDPELKEYTQIIIGEADRLQALVSRILGGAPGREERRVMNIHEILEHVHQLVSVNLPDTIQTITDYDPSIPDIVVARDQLVQAVLNIVRNAVEAVNGIGQIVFRTRIRRQVTIGHNRYRLALSIEIEDSGPGIPKELADNVFLPMVTGRPDGTGLGLSIAQSIIFQHGGFIEFDSHPGRTIFSLILPLETNR